MLALLSPFLGCQTLSWGHDQHGSEISSVQSLRHVRLSATPWTAAHQAFLSITNSQSLLKLMCVESVMPSDHLILCRPLLFLPQSVPASGSFQMSQFFPSDGQSIGVSASASVLPMNIQDCVVAAYFWPFSHEPATGKLSSSRSTKTVLISCCQNHHWVFVRLKYSVSRHDSNIFRSESLSLFNLTFSIPRSLVLSCLTGLFLSFLLVFSRSRWPRPV